MDCRNFHLRDETPAAPRATERLMNLASPRVPAASAMPVAGTLDAAGPSPAEAPPLETVRLGAGEPLVPPDLVTSPFRQDARGVFRDLAALLLDRHLRRLARMRSEERRVGKEGRSRWSQ